MPALNNNQGSPSVAYAIRLTVDASQDTGWRELQRPDRGGHRYANGGGTDCRDVEWSVGLAMEVRTYSRLARIERSMQNARIAV